MDNQTQQIQFPQQTQQAIVPPVSEPPKSFGWLKWVLVVVVVALFSSVTTYFIMNQLQQNQKPPQVIQVTPTPTPDLYREPTSSAATANWKIYNNTKYRFSFKYPVEWTFQELNPYENELVRLESQVIDKQGIGPTVVSLTINNRTIDPSRLQAIGIIDKGSPMTYGDLNGSLYETKNVGIAGYGYRIDFIFNKHPYTYWAYVVTDSVNKEIYQKFFDQILSTFKFIE